MKETDFGSHYKSDSNSINTAKRSSYARVEHVRKLGLSSVATANKDVALDALSRKISDFTRTQSHQSVSANCGGQRSSATDGSKNYSIRLRSPGVHKGSLAHIETLNSGSRIPYDLSEFKNPFSSTALGPARQQNHFRTSTTYTAAGTRSALGKGCLNGRADASSEPDLQSGYSERRNREKRYMEQLERIIQGDTQHSTNVLKQGTKYTAVGSFTANPAMADRKKGNLYTATAPTDPEMSDGANHALGHHLDDMHSNQLRERDAAASMPGAGKTSHLLASWDTPDSLSLDTEPQEAVQPLSSANSRGLPSSGSSSQSERVSSLSSAHSYGSNRFQDLPSNQHSALPPSSDRFTLSTKQSLSCPPSSGRVPQTSNSAQESTLIDQVAMTTSPGLGATSKTGFLDRFCGLVDRYWNGSGSLQMHPKFQDHARDLLEDYTTSVHQSASPRPDALYRPSSELKKLREENNQLRARLSAIEERPRAPIDAPLDISARCEDAEITPPGVGSSTDVKSLRTELDETRQHLTQTQQENRRLQEKVSKLGENARRELSAPDTTGSATSLHDELNRLKFELKMKELQVKQSTQIQELASMLQESHKSLVETNEHLLRELMELREKEKARAERTRWQLPQGSSTGSVPNVAAPKAAPNNHTELDEIFFTNAMQTLKGRENVAAAKESVLNGH